MSKKRKDFRKRKTSKQHHQAIQPKGNRDSELLENLILSQLYSAKTPLSTKEIANLPVISGQGEKKVSNSINILIKNKLIYKNSKNTFSIHKNALMYEGLLEQNPRGFGFVSTVEQSDSKKNLVKDIYIAASRLGESRHGDKVLVRILNIKRNGRPEGNVIKVLSHGPDTVAGILTKKHGEYIVYPDDPRFPFVIKVKKPLDSKIQEEDCVIAKYNISDTPSKVQRGEILERIGSPKTVQTQTRLVIEKFQLPYELSEQIKQEIEGIDENFVDIAEREDLRSTQHITIDGETAKDFDDAIYVTQTDTGYRLYVSIADVSHFVKPGSQIDKEAYARGTSVYFPGTVIPMLPEKLSNDLCSLKPDRDRFTVTAILDFDKNAELLKSRFCRSIIQSKCRFTYTAVGKIIGDKDPSFREQFKPFLNQLELAEMLAGKLKLKRQQRGSVDFNLTEPEFSLTATGEIASIKASMRTKAHLLIEEFMLAANEAVAEYFSDKCQTALYRVHELPDQEKLDQFLTFANSFDIKIPKKDNHPKFLANILDAAKGSKYQFIINNLLLRSLKQAKYSTHNVGHFGLASPNYTHFTSPIRRYPDLLVHRQLLALIDNSAALESPTRKTALQESCDFLSTRERVAVTAERDMNNRLKVLYMVDFIGDNFDAIISGVTENGLFIEIQDLCISGAVSIDYLNDDYYLFDEKNYRLFGEISARTYQIGDPINVTLTEANLIRKKLEFRPTSLQ